jgi:hypothetical protein
MSAFCHVLDVTVQDDTGMEVAMVALAVWFVGSVPVGIAVGMLVRRSARVATAPTAASPAARSQPAVSYVGPVPQQPREGRSVRTELLGSAGA